MKRRITLSIALALSVVLVSLISSDSTAKAQQQGIYRVDTGVVTLGPNQILRITVDGKFGPQTEAAIRFRRTEYGQGACSGGVCKHTVSSQNTSAPITLASGEAASFDIPNAAFGVRGVVLSSSRDVKVNLSIINSATGEVVAFSGDVGEGTGI